MENKNLQKYQNKILLINLGTLAFSSAQLFLIGLLVQWQSTKLQTPTQNII